MNDEIDIILSQLDAHTPDMPVERIIDELMVVSERLNFAGVDEGPAAYSAEQRQQIEFLLSRDVSGGMLQFILYLAAQHALHYVMDDLSEMFITYCRTYFASRTQIQVTTAVTIGPESKQRLRELLINLHPGNPRVLFTTDRALVGGLTIQVDNHPLSDYSFKAQVVKLIEQYVHKKQQEYYVATN